jgi:hypothetical protein
MPKCRVASLTDASMGKMISILRDFNGDWANKFELAVEGELKEAVDSIVTNRHGIAHGKDVGISFTVIKNIMITL